MSGATHVVVRPERLWPSVKVLLEQHGLTAAQVRATGNRGQLLKSDVLEFLKQPRTAQAARAAPAAAAAVPLPNWQPPPAAQLIKGVGKFVDLPNAALRQQLAHRIAFSKSQVPHSYVSVQCTADRFRNSADEMMVSRQSVLAKLVAATIRQFPAFNAHFVAQGDSVRLISPVDLEIFSAFDYRVPLPSPKPTTDANQAATKTKGAAAAKPASVKAKGDSKKLVETFKTERRSARVLLRNAERKSVHELQAEIDAIIRNPQQADSSNSAGSGSFSLVCHVGDDSAVLTQRPIISAPQVACLAVSLFRSLSVTGKQSDAIAKHTLLNATLSYDARAVDDVSATEFLAAFKQKVEFVI